MSAPIPPLDAEWLESDGDGGFASGTVSGERTRRYHGLLLTATTPPTGRFVLVNGVESSVTTPGGVFALSSQRYAPDVVHPDGVGRIALFTNEPWPTWIFALEDGTHIRHEISVSRADGTVMMTWAIESGASGSVRLAVRPLLSGRDPHALHHENPGFQFDSSVPWPAAVQWTPYPGVPSTLAYSNGEYRHDPVWYRQFLYVRERERGLDHLEDLASPGEFGFDLSQGIAFLAFEGISPATVHDGRHRRDRAHLLRARERERSRRAALGDRLQRAADAYVVRRGEAGRSIVAGYPWFTDWGRDTFIALRGLCHATGRWGDAHSILLSWADSVSDGMLPNRFIESGDTPEYNSVDASLWYVIAVHEHLRLADQERRAVSKADRNALHDAVLKIMSGYAAGTRHGIAVDEDGLLRCGEPGVQLTWMDAKIGDWVVTPRVGKPVEIQALWLNALRVASHLDPAWKKPSERGTASFEQRFWSEERGFLLDVVDVDHVPGTFDASLRPNQIFAIGGLPYPILTGERARRVVDVVERHLVTPMGLRSLAAGEPAYAPRYEGGIVERDGSYHQGTVWPWLIGAFVDAWIRVRGDTAEARRTARERFLAPFLDHLDEAGLGHISEIADAEPPFTPRGCPFQAWSVGEVIRGLQATEVTGRPDDEADRVLSAASG